MIIEIVLGNNKTHKSMNRVIGGEVQNEIALKNTASSAIIQPQRMALSEMKCKKDLKHGRKRI